MLCGLHSKAQDCINADLMILIDWSGSERGHELELASAAAMFVEDLPVSETQLRIGYITFSYSINDIVELSGDKEMLMEEIIATSLTGAWGGTYITEAINISGKYLINERMVPKILIIISDGQISDMKEGIFAITMLKTMYPIAIFAVQIGKEGKENEFQNLIKLTGSPDNVERAAPMEILEALKKLNICG